VRMKSYTHNTTAPQQQQQKTQVSSKNLRGIPKFPGMSISISSLRARNT